MSKYNSEEYVQLEEIRKTLGAHMKRYFDVFVVWGNNGANVPPKPYVTVMPTLKQFENRDYYDNEIRNDRHQVRHFKQTLSFTIFGKDDVVNPHESARNVANAIRRWFNIHGKIVLKQLNVAIVEIGAVNDRTTFIVDSYDYKVGFDVTLRMVQTDSYAKLVQDNSDGKNYDIIETVVVNGTSVSADKKGGR